MECKVATWFFHDVLRERKTRCKETRNLEMHRPTRAVPWNHSGTGSLTQQRAQHGDVFRKDLRRRRKWINSPSVRIHTWYSLSSSSLPHLLCITRRKKNRSSPNQYHNPSLEHRSLTDNPRIHQLLLALHKP